MRKIVLSLMLATSAALPTLATAQDRGHEGGHSAPQQHAQPAPRQVAPQPQQRQAAPQFQQQRQAAAQFQQQRAAPPQFRQQRPPQAFNGGGYRGQFQGRPQQAFQRPTPQRQGQQAFDGQQRLAPVYQAPRQFAQNDGRFDPRHGGDQRGQFRGGDRRDQFRGDDRRGQFQGERREQFAGQRDGDWNRGWRQDRRYDFDRYRYQNRAIFHLQPYYAPYGWGYGYQRFDIGIALYPQLWAEDYWIADPYYYHLPPADGPYRWVRYYNDALLVDIETGQVVDAVYGAFY